MSTMPSDEEDIKTWLDEMQDLHGSDMMAMDGYDDCIAGVMSRFGEEVILVYDREKVIEKLMDQGMTEDDAEEFHEFNQAGAYVGKKTPAFLISKPPKKPICSQQSATSATSLSSRPTTTSPYLTSSS